MNLSWVVIGLFLLVYLGLLVLAIRRPLLARLALREAVRRPGQSAVVVLGLMIGTTAIFATQVLSDSFLDSATRSAYLTWGNVDLLAADGGRFFDPALASGLAADPGLRSSLKGIQAGVELPSSVVDLDRGNGKGLVVLVGFDPATQAPFGNYLLRDGRSTSGQDLGPGEVLVSLSLATALEARIGDRLRVSVGPQQAAELQVAGIAEAEGPGAYTLRPALFAPLANLRPLTGDQGVNVIRVAVPGDGRAELDRAHDLVAQVRTALQALAGGSSLKVREAKREDVEILIKRAESDRSIFTGLSLFVALTGSALVVNLGLALAEERRPRHAVLRALGLSRTGMVTLSVLEGALYGLAAAAVALAPGSIAGLALARTLQGGSLLYAGPVEARTGPTLYPITFGSVALSIAIGTLIVLATLFGTSIRSSRMQISSAIKNLPEPAGRRKRSIWGTALLGGLGLGSIAALVAGNLPVRIVGGVGLVILAAALIGSRISERLRSTLAGVALTVWAAAAVGSIALGRWDSLVMVICAVVSVFGLSLVVASNLRILEIPAGWLKGGAGVTLRPSLAYLTRRPLRAGLGTGAFALVLALMTIFALIIPTFLGQARESVSEYNIRINAPTTPGLSIPDSVRPEISRQVVMPTRPYRGETRTSDGDTRKDQYVPLYSLSTTEMAAEPFELISRESRYKSDAEVWQALASDPHLVVSPIFGNAGLTVTLAGPDGPVPLRVAAVVKNLGLWGIAGSEAAMAVFTTLPVGTTIIAMTVPGADASAVARQIQREVFSQGAEATTVQEIFDSSSRGPQAIVDTMRVLMGIGLLVGVLSLGSLALRAVVERRRTFGVLRALGYRPGQVLVGIVSEGLITATCGALVGIGVGALIGVTFYKVLLPSAALVIDSSSLTLTVGLVYLAVLAVTIPPALRAARLPVVEALRVED
jgi:putative ABC transport system permease protein